MTEGNRPTRGNGVTSADRQLGPVTVLIADDHPVVREGLRGMLAAESGITVVGEAGSGDEAVAMARRYRPDVVLMDLRMPGGDGVLATAGILATAPSTRVVVLTTYETDADIVRAVEAGATGYLLKDTPRPDLVSAIRAAARGETVLGPTVAGRLVSRLRRPAAEPLSARETEVLRLVARGQTNAEIGRALFISEATVKTHLLRAFGKLGVSDRTAAVTRAIELGMLPSPGTTH
jgi:DNA-binding NarL/FixJ family response regulator